MIKKIISVAFVAAVLSVGMYSYTQSQHEKSMNELTLANVEALADGEIIIGPICVYDVTRICYILDDDLGFDVISGYR